MHARSCTSGAAHLNPVARHSPYFLASIPAVSQRKRCRLLSVAPDSEGASTSSSVAAAAAPRPPSGKARVDVGDAYEQIVVPLVSRRSSLFNATLAFPLGLVLEGELTPPQRHKIAVVTITSLAFYRLALPINRCQQIWHDRHRLVAGGDWL